MSLITTNYYGAITMAEFGYGACTRAQRLGCRCTALNCRCGITFMFGHDSIADDLRECAKPPKNWRWFHRHDHRPETRQTPATLVAFAAAVLRRNPEPLPATQRRAWKRRRYVQELRA